MCENLGLIFNCQQYDGSARSEVKSAVFMKVQLL